jgi:putative ABC transport system permease protein
MPAVQIFVIAARNLQRRKTRTVIALLGIAVGVSIVVSIVSSAGGLRRQFYRMAEVFRGDLIATNKVAFMPIQSRVSAQEAADLAKHELVEGTSLLRIWRQPVKNSEGVNQPILILGLRPDDIVTKRYPVINGRPLKNGDKETVIIGELLARDLKKKVNDKIEIFGRSMAICGLYRSPVASVSFLSGGIVMPLSRMCNLLSPTAPVSGNMAIIHVKGFLASDSTPSAKALQELDQRVKKGAEVLPEIYTRLKVQPIAEYLDSFKGQLEIIDQFAWAISILAVIAGGIGIMNTMIMSVFERTREIGLLKALGWPASMIMSVIIIEGALLSIMGGLVGIPLGLIEVKFATYLIKLGWIEVSWDWTLFGQALALATFVGVLGSIYPAARAAAFAPTDALRYE